MAGADRGPKWKPSHQNQPPNASDKRPSIPHWVLEKFRFSPRGPGIVDIHIVGVGDGGYRAANASYGKGTSTAAMAMWPTQLFTPTDGWRKDRWPQSWPITKNPVSAVPVKNQAKGKQIPGRKGDGNVSQGHGGNAQGHLPPRLCGGFLLKTRF